jgi:hypothetical protein
MKHVVEEMKNSLEERLYLPLFESDSDWGYGEACQGWSESSQGHIDDGMNMQNKGRNRLMKR